MFSCVRLGADDWQCGEEEGGGEVIFNQHTTNLIKLNVISDDAFQ